MIRDKCLEIKIYNEIKVLKFIKIWKNRKNRVILNSYYTKNMCKYRIEVKFLFF